MYHFEIDRPCIKLVIHFNLDFFTSFRTWYTDECWRSFFWTCFKHSLSNWQTPQRHKHTHKKYTRSYWNLPTGWWLRRRNQCVYAYERVRATNRNLKKIGSRKPNFEAQHQPQRYKNTSFWFSLPEVKQTTHKLTHTHTNTLWREKVNQPKKVGRFVQGNIQFCIQFLRARTIGWLASDQWNRSQQ